MELSETATGFPETAAGLPETAAELSEPAVGLLYAGAGLRFRFPFRKKGTDQFFISYSGQSKCDFLHPRTKEKRLFGGLSEHTPRRPQPPVQRVMPFITAEQFPAFHSGLRAAGGLPQGAQAVTRGFSLCRPSAP